MTKEQFFIYFLVGLMVFSAIGTGILLLQGSGSDSDSTIETTITDDSLSVNEPVDVETLIPLEDRFLPTGEVVALETVDLTVGSGTEVQPGDTVTVNYTGWLASDGSIFDSSLSRGVPASFPLSSVITGWQDGIPGMREGGVRRLVIPADQAYGSAAREGIPANSALVFEVELISVP